MFEKNILFDFILNLSIFEVLVSYVDGRLFEDPMNLLEVNWCMVKYVWEIPLANSIGCGVV